MTLPSLASKKELFDFLDDYASTRKQELDKGKLQSEVGLVKSFVLETSHNRPSQNPVEIVKQAGWLASPIEDGEAYSIIHPQAGEIGYLDILSDRYYLFHSLLKADPIDKLIHRDVTNTSALDFMWVSGTFFLDIWKHHVLPQNPKRYVRFKFEFEQTFSGYEARHDDLDESGDTQEENETEFEDKKSSSMLITENVEKIKTILPKLQGIHSPFKSIRMLRLPSPVSTGGYELWQWGKLTHRAPDFRNGRLELIRIVNVYEQVTEAIEQLAWISASTFPQPSAPSFTGMPITIELEEDLDQETFEKFIKLTFERGQGPLRIWGNPIFLSKQRVHVYGIDLHLWQSIFLDLTPKRFVAYLPKGTCGNTVHRLATNIQHYLSPGIRIFCGEIPFESIVSEAFQGK